MATKPNISSNYGTTTEYGLLTPASLTSIGSGSEPIEVAQTIENLQPGFTYHFRVVATNEWGTSFSDDTSYDFTPPTCPNGHVRQQTRASFLPDCRAYELVSPGSAGAALMLPSDAIWDNIGSGNTYYGEEVGWLQNTGFATSPPRFSFWTAVSSLPGTNSPVGFKDMDISTRTNTGWVTKVPGLHNIQAYQTGRKICSDALSLCLDHSESTELGYQREAAPLRIHRER